MSDPEWKLVSNMSLREYPCGVKVDDRLVLKREIVCKNHKGEPTGETHAPGPGWRVLTGDPEEAETVWLRQPDGERHTWDGEDLLNWFDLEQQS